MKNLFNKKILSIILVLSMVFCFNLSGIAYAKDTDKTIVGDEILEDGTLIEITPYTNLEELPGIDINSDIYNELVSEQSQMQKNTRNLIPNKLQITVSMVGSTSVKIAMKNIGIDTLDMASFNFSGYNYGSGTLAARANRTRYGIAPMATVTETVYVQPTFQYAVIVVTATDGSVANSGTFYFYK